MKQSVVPLLACPRRTGEGTCGGALAPAPEAGPPARMASGDELVEGGLRCLSCGGEYPVLSGAAVLVPDSDGYLRRYYHSVLRDIGRHGELSPEARTWLARRFSRGAGREDY